MLCCFLQRLFNLFFIFRITTSDLGGQHTSIDVVQNILSIIKREKSLVIGPSPPAWSPGRRFEVEDGYKEKSQEKADKEGD